MVKEDILRHYRFPEARIAVIYNGVDLLRFHPRNREQMGKTVRRALGLGPDEQVLLLVGSGFERKGVWSLIHGAAEALARGRHTPLKLIIAGKGNPRPYLALARRLGLAGQVLFVGIWPQVEALYAAANAFVLPTLYDPFSNACLEAMASGLPVLTSEANGASELIVHGRNGFIVEDPMNPSEIGGKLVELFEEERRRVMGLKARETAEHFPIGRPLIETLKIWQEVLAEKSRVVP
jgi:UDP-glucose:(heptosyl)LPS alpha-1,3-glucosyltransferase